jgi:hypothetical protein
VQQAAFLRSVVRTAAVALLALAGSACGGTIDGPAPDDRDGLAADGNPNAPGGRGAQNGANTDTAGGNNSTTGNDTGGAATANLENESAACTADLVKTSPLRRLSHTEYNRTVRALFPGLDIPRQDFAADLLIHGFENNADAMNASPVLVEQYTDAAGRIAQIAAENSDAVLPCTPSGNDTTCASDFIATFGRDAFRRPLSSEERARYEGFFAQQMAALSFDAAFELTVQAFLMSPQFLYRLELGASDETPGQVLALDDYAIASRLSFLVLQSMPDAELFAAAERGQLHTLDQIEAQTRRMLGTEAATAALVDYHRQWLDFDRLMTEDKDPGMFPDWNEGLQAAMREESDRFVAHVFGQQGTGSIQELLTSNVSFVNGELAQLYGVDVSGSGWQQVTLPSAERAGLLTRANFLASRAHSTNGSPPLRGVAVLDQLLCSRPPPPPPTVNTSLSPNDSDSPVTNRQLFEARTGVAACQGCHKSINGIGYGMEAFDSIGRFRTTDNGFPVDAAGELVSTINSDGPYDGAVELSQKLASSEQVERCAVTNMYRYAMARDTKQNDSCKLDALTTAMKRSGGDIRELIVSIATSHEFTHRKVSL